MNDEYYISLIGEAFDGYSEVTINGKEAYIKHVSLQDQRYLHKYYEKYKIYGNMMADALLRIDAIKQDINDLKQSYDHIGEDGKVIETFTLPRPVDEMKEEMNEFIDNSMKEIEQLKEMRQECFDRIKEKNYEHIL